MWIIDAHQDVAYNMLTHHRDYRRSARETRALERSTEIPARTGECVLGWPDYQQAQVALFFGTLYLSPRKIIQADWETQSYLSAAEARKHHLEQYDAYCRLADENPGQFRLIREAGELETLLAEWDSEPADFPHTTHPTGIVLLMEGAEGLGEARELEDWAARGLRFVGPVWGGGRYCGAGFGDLEPRGFDREGYELLEVMADLEMCLDLSHMNHRSSLQALDVFQGKMVIASHANCHALLPGYRNERHLVDEAIARLAERGGVIGTLPSNSFLRVDWRKGDPRENVTLETWCAHIDHICQIAGSSEHAAIGTDFDGGFGYPNIPYELDTIGDLQKLGALLEKKGYNENDIKNIFGANWGRVLRVVLDKNA
ncbi:MAG: membrane dipeptidase [Anaerolineaceae bacterium]|nr:membrane dipeptidase [Anaerolineaceae bacterium]